MRPQNLQNFRGKCSEQGFSFIEIAIAIFLITFIIGKSFEFFFVNSKSSETIGSRLEADNLLTAFTSEITQKNIAARSLNTDPLPTNPLPPTNPIKKIVFRFFSKSGAIAQNSYENVCRTYSPTPPTWYGRALEPDLRNLRNKIAAICDTQNPCPDKNTLPYIKIVEQKNATAVATNYFPKDGTEKKGLLAASALCVDWRPEGGGTFDIKVVGGYLNPQKQPEVVVSSMTISNTSLGNNSVLMMVP